METKIFERISLSLLLSWC